LTCPDPAHQAEEELKTEKHKNEELEEELEKRHQRAETMEVNHPPLLTAPLLTAGSCRLS